MSPRLYISYYKNHDFYWGYFLNLIDIIKGNSDFRKHISESRSRLYRTAFSWCHDPDVADDVVQQPFIKLFKIISRLKKSPP